MDEEYVWRRSAWQRAATPNETEGIHPVTRVCLIDSSGETLSASLRDTRTPARGVSLTDFSSVCVELVSYLLPFQVQSSLVEMTSTASAKAALASLTRQCAPLVCAWHTYGYADHAVNSQPVGRAWIPC